MPSFDAYHKLNDILNSTFFDHRFESRPIYLYVEDALKDEISERLGINADSLESVVGEAVGDSLSFQDSNIYIWHITNIRRWRLNKYEGMPPFTALLVSFSMAAGRMRSTSEYSQTNFYQRLVELFSLETDEDRQKKLRQCHRLTVEFWLSINRWLTDNNYAYGIPTARTVVKSWKYVSYALSQSLIREEDRISFTSLFEEFKFSPGERISESEMRLYLHQWMGRAEAGTSWLRKIWATEELRERVAQSAQVALENWDGSSVVNREGNISAARRLSWVLSVSTFIKKKASFYLAVGATNNDGKSVFNIHEEKGYGFRKDYGDSVGDLWLEELPGTELNILRAKEKLRLSYLLQTNLKFAERASRKLFLEHNARLIIPLVRLDNGNFYKEVSRAPLFKDTILLVHYGMKDMVVRHLDKYEYEYKDPDSNKIASIPDDWVLIEGVRFNHVPNEDIDGNLQSLVPLVESSIEFLGGLQISSKVWHASAPPDVLAVNQKGQLSIRLKAIGLEGGEKEIHKEEISNYDPSFLGKLEARLAGNEFLIESYKNSNVSSQSSISFKSALLPRVLIEGRDQRLCILLNSEKKNLLRFPLENISGVQSNEVFLIGYRAEGDHFPVIEPLRSVDLSVEVLEAPIDVDDAFFSLEATQQVANVHPPYHIWNVSEGASAKKGVGSMKCELCGVTQLVRKYTRPRRRNLKNVPQRVFFKRGHVQQGACSRLVNADTVFDAICYLGAGKYRALESLVSAQIEEAWRARSVIKNLNDLGHLEIDVEPGKRTGLWSCNPPDFVKGTGNIYFLTGYRNDELVAQVIERICGLGLELDRRTIEGAVTSYRWINDAGVEDSAISVALEGVVDPINRPLQFVESPTLRVLSALPNIENMIGLLAQVSVGDGSDLEYFDLGSGKWLRRESNLQSGAYRTNYNGRHYFYRDSNGKCFESTFELAKLLAARGAGYRLHKYCPEKELFESVIGCEPPGLFRRVLISCSGLLPIAEENTSTFSNVPQEIGALVMNKLYG